MTSDCGNIENNTVLCSRDGVSVYLLLGLVLFSLAYGPYLLNDALLYDDAVWFRQGFEGGIAAKQQLFDLGRPWLWYMVVAMDWIQNFFGPYLNASRVYGFACYLTAYLVSFYSLCLMRFFSVANCFWIASLSALAPLNFSRVCAVNTLSYGTAYLLFVLGVYVAINRFRHQSFRSGVLISGLLLFLSYFVPSLICFGIILWIPFYFAQHISLKESFSWRREWSFLRKFVLYNPHFWLPVLLAVLFYKAPTGSYAKVNAMNVGKISHALLVLPYALLKNVVALFNIDVYCTYSLNTILLTACAGAILALGFAVIWFLYPRTVRKGDCSNLSSGWILAISCLLLVAALFPYVLVGKAPMPRQWEDRHQLTLALVIGPVLFAWVSVLGKEKIRPWILGGLVAMFTAMTSVGYQFFLYESHIRDAVVSKLRATDAVRASETVLFNFDFIYDKSGFRLPRLLDNRMQIQEFNDLLVRAYGDMGRGGMSYNWEGQQKLAETLDGINRVCAHTPNFLCDGAPYAPPRYVVAVRPGPDPFLTRNAVQIQFTKMFSPARYARRLEEAITISMIPLAFEPAQPKAPDAAPAPDRDPG
jgi:hypothetical protein